MKGGCTIVWVAANFDETGDGVGKYAARLVGAVRPALPEWRIEVATARTTDLGRGRRFVSGRMAGCLLAVARRVVSGGIGAVVVEYPFLEQSPAIIPAMRALRRACSMAGTELVLSLHEYSRVGRLRQWSIRYLVGMADKILVTDEVTASALRHWTRSRVWIREIPSNIPRVTATAVPRDPCGFCYFGVVNRSKAVSEMLEGWRAVWRPGMLLHFLTASVVDVRAPGIVLHQGLSDSAVAQVLVGNSFQVLPILPVVETNSGSLKAGLLNGLIPIGRPGVTLGGLASSFLRVEAYTPEHFAGAFRSAVDLSLTEREVARTRLLAGSECWTAAHCAGQVAKALLASRQ